MLQQGLSPDSSDYDGRTALMLAAGQGHLEAVKLLLSTGAHPSLTDSLQVQAGEGTA
jgi:ankyrin repeat protein